MTDTQIPPIAVSPAEAGRLLQMSRGQIYVMINDGTFRTFKIGRKTRIPFADLVAYMEQQLTARAATD